MAILKDLLVNGTSRFIGKIYGTISNADLATKATGDGDGNTISSTYAKSVALTGDVTGSATVSSGAASISTTLVNSGATAGSYGPSANASPAHGGTFSVPYVTVDAKGRVTAASTKTITLPASGNTDKYVLQGKSTTSNWRNVLLGYNDTSVYNTDITSVTNQVYETKGFSFQPSTGTLKATTFSGNLTGNVTGNCSGSSGSCTGNAATATKATQDGDGNVITSTYYTKSSATTDLATKSDTSHKHGLLHTDLCVNLANTTTDSGWSMINSSYNGHILKSIRTQANAPSWIRNDYAAGIAFGGGDTHGVISCAYGQPYIKFAGGNGTKPVWWIQLAGTNGKSYTLPSTSSTLASTTDLQSYAKLPQFMQITDSSTSTGDGYSITIDSKSTVGNTEYLRASIKLTTSKSDYTIAFWSHTYLITSITADTDVTIPNGSHLHIMGEFIDDFSRWHGMAISQHIDSSASYNSTNAELSWQPTNHFRVEEYIYWGAWYGKQYYQAPTFDVITSGTAEAVFPPSTQAVYNKLQSYVTSTTLTTTLSGYVTTSGTAAVASKLGTSTVGGTGQPIYLKSGVATKITALSASYGGTGKTSLVDSANALLNALSTGSSTPVDADYYISQYVNGGTTTTTYHRRPMSQLWTYVSGKVKSTYLPQAEYTYSTAYSASATIELPSGYDHYKLLAVRSGSQTGLTITYKLPATSSLPPLFYITVENPGFQTSNSHVITTNSGTTIFSAESGQVSATHALLAAVGGKVLLITKDNGQSTVSLPFNNIFS